jgi:predicted dehydrogenase
VNPGENRKLRIGMVGAGGIVRKRHLPGLLALPNVQIVAVCNSRVESAQKIADEFGIPEVVSDWAELLDRPDLDIIWIGTPPMNLREGREMLEAAQSRPHLVTMLCPPPHGMRGGRFFQKLLRDGYAGELWQFRLSALSDKFSDPLAPVHWRQRTELNGLNALTVGIYAEVLQRWLGSPRRLHAQMKVSIPKRQGYVVHMPDIVQVFGQWPFGLAGTLEWSGVAQFPPDETLTVYGRAGTLVYNFTRDEILGARRGEKELSPLAIPPELESHWTVEKDFIDAVLHGGHPEPSFETGVRYMEFTEAMHLSARGGHAVELPLP